MGDLNNTGKDMHNVFNTQPLEGTATLKSTLVPYPDLIYAKEVQLNNNINLSKSFRPKNFIQTFNQNTQKQTLENQSKPITDLTKHERIRHFKQEYEEL